MAQNTWNFPCWTTMDNGPLGGTRGNSGTLWEVGPGGNESSNTQPFTNSITAIFSFFIRTGWTDISDLRQVLFSLGYSTATEPAFELALALGGSTPIMQAKAYDTAAATVRGDVRLGDEDGTNWIQPDKWYQVGVSIDGSSFTYAVNGVNTPKLILPVDAPGTLNLDRNSERIWVHGPQASWGIAANNIIVHWPSMVMGPAAFGTVALDFNDAAVRARIWDSNGDFINPFENGSGWFNDDYTISSGFMPNYYLTDGSPRYLKGSDTQQWEAVGGGTGNHFHAPGGLRKQYEA